MSVKTISVMVPAETFLMLARLYRELPQEQIAYNQWMIIRDLERRAYRKLKHAKENTNGSAE